MTKPRSGNEEDENTTPLTPQSPAGILGIGTVRWPQACAERPRSLKDLVARFDRGLLGDEPSSSNASTPSDRPESSSCSLSDGAAAAATEQIFRSPDCSVVSVHAASSLGGSARDGSLIADVSLTSSSSGCSSGSNEVLTADDKTMRRRRRGRKRIVAAVLVALLVAALALILGIVLREEGGDDTVGNVVGSQGDPRPSDNADDKTDRPAPATSPTATPATIPTTASPTKPPGASVEARLRDALTSAMRDPSLLSDPTSPQGMAFDWLSKDPIASMRLRRSPDGEGDDRIVQRYALAVLYFSTVPPSLHSSPPFDGRALSERRNGRPRTTISTLRARQQGDALLLVRRRRTGQRGGTGSGWRNCGAVFNPTKNDREGEGKDDEESPASNRISCWYDANEGIICDDDQSDVAPSNNDTEDGDDEEDRYRDDPIWCYNPQRGRDEEEVAYRFLSNVDECDWFGIECDDEDENSTDGSPGGVVTKIRLESNNINGTLPPELLALSHLQTLNLFDNAMRGSIPSDMGRSLTRLVDLNLSNNDLSGPLPSSLYDLRDLIVLDMSMNDLTGTVDDDLIPGWTNLATLELYGNQFRGTVPWYGLGSIQSLAIAAALLRSFLSLLPPSSFGFDPNHVAVATGARATKASLPLRQRFHSSCAFIPREGGGGNGIGLGVWQDRFAFDSSSLEDNNFASFDAVSGSRPPSDDDDGVGPEPEDKESTSPPPLLWGGEEDAGDDESKASTAMALSSLVETAGEGLVATMLTPSPVVAEEDEPPIRAAVLMTAVDADNAAEEEGEEGSVAAAGMMTTAPPPTWIGWSWWTRTTMGRSRRAAAEASGVGSWGRQWKQ